MSISSDMLFSTDIHLHFYVADSYVFNPSASQMIYFPAATLTTFLDFFSVSFFKFHSVFLVLNILISIGIHFWKQRALYVYIQLLWWVTSSFRVRIFVILHCKLQIFSLKSIIQYLMEEFFSWGGRCMKTGINYIYEFETFYVLSRIFILISL